MRMQIHIAFGVWVRIAWRSGVCADKVQRGTASSAHGRFPFPVPKLQGGDLLLQSVDLLPS